MDHALLQGCVRHMAMKILASRHVQLHRPKMTGYEGFRSGLHGLRGLLSCQKNNPAQGLHQRCIKNTAAKITILRLYAGARQAEWSMTFWDSAVLWHVLCEGSDRALKSHGACLLIAACATGSTPAFFCLVNCEVDSLSLQLKMLQESHAKGAARFLHAQ